MDKRSYGVAPCRTDSPGVCGDPTAGASAMHNLVKYEVHFLTGARDDTPGIEGKRGWWTRENHYRRRGGRQMVKRATVVDHLARAQLARPHLKCFDHELDIFHRTTLFARGLS